MDRDQLCAALVAARPGLGDTVYVERRGDAYAWHRVGSEPVEVPPELPDAWIYYSWQWDPDATPDAQAVIDDLLAEMDSMTGGVDRCRWSVDDPWPHAH